MPREEGGWEGTRGRDDRLPQGPSKEVDLFAILTVVIVSCVDAYINRYQIIHLKYVQQMSVVPQ